MGVRSDLGREASLSGPSVLAWELDPRIPTSGAVVKTNRDVPSTTDPTLTRCLLVLEEFQEQEEEKGEAKQDASRTP